MSHETDLYLLIHPELEFSNPRAIVRYDFESYDYDDLCDFMDSHSIQWGSLVADMSARAKAKAAVLYSEPFSEDSELLVGVPLQGWEYNEADGVSVVSAALCIAEEALADAGLGDPKGLRCMIAGTTREDCIQRVSDALREELGMIVELHEPAVLPINSISSFQEAYSSCGFFEVGPSAEGFIIHDDHSLESMNELLDALERDEVDEAYGLLSDAGAPADILSRAREEFLSGDTMAVRDELDSAMMFITCLLDGDNDDVFIETRDGKQVFSTLGGSWEAAQLDFAWSCGLLWLGGFRLANDPA